MATSFQIPHPLTSEEIAEGIAVRISADAEVEDRDREPLKLAIMTSLTKTCSLNRTVYSKFSASWRMNYGYKGDTLLARWWVDYELDDFGRVAKGGIGGNIGNPPEGAGVISEGKIEEMPPDRFRRETKQPIPAPQVVKPKDQNQLGVTRSPRVSVKGKDA